MNRAKTQHYELEYLVDEAWVEELLKFLEEESKDPDFLVNKTGAHTPLGIGVGWEELENDYRNK